MHLTDAEKIEILFSNPQIQAVYDSPDPDDDLFVVLIDNPLLGKDLVLPDNVDPARCRKRHNPPFTTLERRGTHPVPENEYQFCQDEPIKLGCQIQPNGAPWVGTAGCPVQWTNPDGKRHWGILSNWHVFSSGRYNIGWDQHQPTDYQPSCARLSAMTAVNPDGPNNTDAAIADALIDGFHTIDWSILQIGKLTPTIGTAKPAMPVVKSGRTTGTTGAVCTAVDVTARIGYADFEAIFTGQDLFTDVGGSFSAAGDSGSCIVDAKTGEPVSLLFAGGGNTTLGNPIQTVAAKLNLHFSP